MVTGRLLVVTVAVLTVGTLGGTAGACPPAAKGQRLAVPAYFTPGEEWARLAGARPSVGIAVANAANGPGQYDPAYAAAVAAASRTGIRVLGYVDTGYLGTTGRPTRSGATDHDAWTAQIAADVDTWYAYYGRAGLAGVFFDATLAAAGPGNQYVRWYQEIGNEAKRHGRHVFTVDNPGQAPDRAYLSAADVLVTFEGDGAAYRDWQPPSWQRHVDRARLWHLVYDVPDRAALADTLALSRQRNAGYIYVTDRTLASNPWGALPGNDYWADEVNATVHAGQMI
jgi:Spherulation-specific family 4